MLLRWNKNLFLSPYPTLKETKTSALTSALKSSCRAKQHFLYNTPNMQVEEVKGFTYWQGADRKGRWHTAAWRPHRSGPWTSRAGRRRDDAPLDIVGSDYSRWPTGLQSTVAYQSVASGPGTLVASAPGEAEKKRHEGGVNSGGVVRSSRGEGWAGGSGETRGL